MSGCKPRRFSRDILNPNILNTFMPNILNTLMYHFQVIDKNGFPYFEVEYKEAKKIFSPSQIAVTIYKKMLETAQSHGGSGIQDSVLAVPLYFSTEQRKAVRYGNMDSSTTAKKFKVQKTKIYRPLSLSQIPRDQQIYFEIYQ